MKRRDRAKLLCSRFFHSQGIILAAFIVAIMLATCLPLSINNGSSRSVNGEGLWHRLWELNTFIERSGSRWEIAHSDMGHFDAKLRNSIWIAGENIFVDNGSPKENSRFAAPCRRQQILRELNVGSIGSLRADNCRHLLWEQWELEALGQVCWPRLPIRLNYCFACGSIASIDPVQRKFLTRPVFAYIAQPNSKPDTGKTEKRSLRTPGGFIGTLANLIQLRREKHEHGCEESQEPSKDSSPRGRPVSKAYVVYFREYAFLCCATIFGAFSILGSICIVWHSLDSGRPRYLIVATVGLAVGYLMAAYVASALVKL